MKESPSREQRPNPAATDRATSSTPASPTAPWDLAQSHLSMVTQAYASWGEPHTHTHTCVVQISGNPTDGEVLVESKLTDKSIAALTMSR